MKRAMGLGLATTAALTVASTVEAHATGGRSTSPLTIERMVQPLP